MYRARRTIHFPGVINRSCRPPGDAALLGRESNDKRATKNHNGCKHEKYWFEKTATAPAKGDRHGGEVDQCHRSERCAGQESQCQSGPELKISQISGPARFDPQLEVRQP